MSHLSSIELMQLPDSAKAAIREAKNYLLNPPSASQPKPLKTSSGTLRCGWVSFETFERIVKHQSCGSRSNKTSWFRANIITEGGEAKRERNVCQEGLNIEVKLSEDEIPSLGIRRLCPAGKRKSKKSFDKKPTKSFKQKKLMRNKALRTY